MTIVINEFEVVPEAAPAASPSTATEQPASLYPAAPDIEQLLRHIGERALRVRAH